MRLRALFISFLLLLSVITAAAVTIQRNGVACGSQFTLRANANADYHFVRWSDGNTDSVRTIEVRSNANYIAYYEPNCGDYANVPLVSLYDWLMMVNVKALRDKGYDFDEDDVRWYFVNGDPDPVDGAIRDDDLICFGFYLTLDKPLTGTGDYYAIVDVSGSTGTLCKALMRSEMAHYSSTERLATRPRPYLAPAMVRHSENVQVCNLPEDEEALITIYDAAGAAVASYRSANSSTFRFQAMPAAGCYIVRIETDGKRYVLRFIVH